MTSVVNSWDYYHDVESKEPGRTPLKEHVYWLFPFYTFDTTILGSRGFIREGYYVLSFTSKSGLPTLPQTRTDFVNGNYHMNLMNTSVIFILYICLRSV